jgi:phosphohistidine phosphatase
MRRLLLLRHGEAEPERPGLAEFERPLTARGRLEALAVAQLVRGSQPRLDLLLASPAQRVRETANIVAAQLDMPAAPRFEPPLYLGSAEVLLEALRRCSDRLGVVLLVAHNPGLSELASRLASDLPPFSLCTGGLAQLEFGGHWSELAAESCAGALLR